jgi:threonine aldolase
MYSFKYDYSELGHERILNDLLKISNVQLVGYGLDSVCEQAKDLIKTRFDLGGADIHFLSGGTQTNLIFINSALSPVEALISADTGHIYTNECGAIEHNGNKIITAPNYDGKLLPSDIESIFEAHNNEHKVVPKLVFISQSTEKGTVYLKKELESLFDTCKKLGLYLYIDGARLGPALVSDGMDIKPADIGKLCDAFYIGGTKNGSPLGEALCIINKNLKKGFRNYLKQHGALLSKGALAGSCFKTLFEDDLFFENARHSNKMAQKLVKAFAEKGYRMNSASPTNQIFPILPNVKITELQKHFDFYIWQDAPDNNSVIRLVCSWATNENEIDKLISIL